MHFNSKNIKMTKLKIFFSVFLLHFSLFFKLGIRCDEVFTSIFNMLKKVVKPSEIDEVTAKSKFSANKE